MPSSECLDAEVLAAWFDGTLSAAHRLAAEEHAAGCAYCRSMLSAMAQTAPEEPRRPWFVRAGVVRWLVPLTAAVTVVAIWIAVPRQHDQVSMVWEDLANREAAAPVAPPPAEPAGQAGGTAAGLEAKPQEGDGRRQALRDEAKQEERQDPAGPAVPGPPPAPVLVPAPAPSVPLREPAVSADTAAAPRERSMLPFARPAVIESVAGSDPAVRWRILDGTTIERSVDGGRSWTRAAVPAILSAERTPPVTATAISALSASSARVTTSDGAVFATEDGGATWIPVQEKPAGPF